MNKKIYKVYVVTCTKNNKKYVGITQNTIEYRWKQHIRNNHCTALANAISSYGKNFFYIKEIYNSLYEDEINYREQYFIDYYNTLSPNGYNLTTGGKHHSFSDEIKEDMSKRMFERHKTENLTTKIAQHSIKKRKQVVGVNFKTFEIIRFTNIHSAEKAKYYPNEVLLGNSAYSKGMMWYYDKGESDQELIERTKALNIQTKNSWINCDREKRTENIKNGQKHRFQACISVNIHTGQTKIYETMNDVIRAGFSASSVYSSINRVSVKGQGYVWYHYDIKLPLEYYIKDAEVRLKGFK